MINDGSVLPKPSTAPRATVMHINDMIFARNANGDWRLFVGTTTGDILEFTNVFTDVNNDRTNTAYTGVPRLCRPFPFQQSQPSSFPR